MTSVQESRNPELRGDEVLSVPEFVVWLQVTRSINEHAIAAEAADAVRARYENRLIDHCLARLGAGSVAAPKAQQ